MHDKCIMWVTENIRMCAIGAAVNADQKIRKDGGANLWAFLNAVSGRRSVSGSQ
jgi:hypothetical protein